MTPLQIALITAGSACAAIGALCMMIRQSTSDDSSVAADIDFIAFGGFFSIIADILRALRNCFRRPSRKNAPELLLFFGVGLLALAFVVA